MKYISNRKIVRSYLGELATKTKIMCKAFVSSEKLREQTTLFDENGIAEYAIDNDMIEYQMKLDDEKLSPNKKARAVGMQGYTAEPVRDEYYFKELPEYH